MTINDGYGEPTVDEALDDWDRWLYGAARWLVAGDHRFDDVLQEGRVEFWKAYEAMPEEPNRVQYSLHRARLRMREVAHPAKGVEGQRRSGRRGLTGHSSMQGRPEVKVVAHLDKPVGEGPLTLADLLGKVEAIDGVEMAYHYGEIMQAINTLPEQHRQYVYRRFWLGDNSSEIARELGLSVTGMHNRWSRTIRPALVESLSHLQGALA